MLIIFRPIYTSDTLLLEDNQFPDICLICPTPKNYIHDTEPCIIVIHVYSINRQYILT